MSKILKLLVGIGIISNLSYAHSVVIQMHLTNKSQTSVGQITATDTEYGVVFTPHLTGLVPYLYSGVHGLHIHENHSCAKMGMAAGGHLDPKKTGHHLGPYADGHLGDLPVLYVNADGTANLSVFAPRLTVKDILGHSLMIHNGGDNYSDEPQPLGGGGKRMVCGVIPYKPAK